MEISVGDKLGPYQLLAPIGEGGMGEVWKARDTRLDRIVALKISKQEFTERFEREARAIAALNHPNVCQLYDVGPNYLVLEYVEGPTLADRVEQGPIPIAESIAIARQICDAMEAAHEKGIIHRDLKLGNVKLRQDRTVKVLDFGLARIDELPFQGSPADSPTLTMRAGMSAAGMILGTAGYMAPEQARGYTVDKRADIWAFGVVLFEMLTGKRLFRGESVSDTLAAVLRQEIDFSLLPDGTPANIRRLVRRCLERDAKRRLRDFGDAGFDEVDEGGPSIAQPVSRLPWAVAAIACLAAAVLGVLQFRSTPAEQRPVRRFSIAPEDYAGGASISPNGKHIIYRGNNTLWIRDLDRVDARPLAGAEGSLYFFWAPDSRSILCLFGTTVSVRRVPIHGGSSTVVASGLSPIRSLAWSADGTSILYSPFHATDAIEEMPVKGGPARTVLGSWLGAKAKVILQELPPEGGPRAVIYSTTEGSARKIGVANLASGTASEFLEARYALYSRKGYLVFRTEEGIYAVPFSRRDLKITGEPTLVADSRGPGSFSMSDDGTLVFDDVPRRAPEQLTWRDRTGNKIGTVGQPQIEMSYPDFSPDGTRVAVGAVDQGNVDIWIYELKSGVRSRLTFEPGTDWMPAWSPNGREIAFASARQGPGGIFVQAADGSGKARPVLVSPGQKLLRGWSRTGVLSFNLVDPKSRFDIWTIEAKPDGGFQAPAPFLATPAMEYLGTVSPDGRFMLYASDESGRNEVYVKPFPDTGGKWQVSPNGGFWPRWRRDGKEIYFFENDTLIAIPASTQGGFSHGTPRRLFSFPPQGSSVYRKYEPFGDGERFLFVEPEARTRGTDRVVQILENWTEEINAARN